MYKNVTFLIENDYASNNYCVYVPNLRLNVVGETEEKALSHAKDLAVLGLSDSSKTYTSKVVTIQVNVKTYTILVEVADNFYGYVPELRLNIVGDSEEEILAFASELIENAAVKSNEDCFACKVVTLQIQSALQVDFAKIS